MKRSYLLYFENEYLNGRPQHEHGAVVDVVLDHLVDGAVQGHDEAGHRGQNQSEPSLDVSFVELVKFVQPF